MAAESNITTGWAAGRAAFGQRATAACVALCATVVTPGSWVSGQETPAAALEPSSTPRAAGAPDQPTPQAGVFGEVGEVENTSSVIENQFKPVADDGDLAAAGILGAFAKSVDEDFDRLFGLSEAWSVPINLKLYGGIRRQTGRQDSRTEVEFFDDAASFEVTLHLKLPEGFSNRWLEGEILRVLILERMLNSEATRSLFVNLPAGDAAAAREASASIEVPYWLQVGIAEVIDHRSRGRPSELYSRMVRSRQVLPIEQVLQATEDGIGDDTLSRAVFRASAGALVAALVDQEEGAVSFLRWLGDLPSQRDNLTALFRRHFPQLRSGDASLAKWWTLQVAAMGQLQALEFMNVADTEAAIDRALRIREPEVVGDAGEAGSGEGRGAIGRVLDLITGDDGEGEGFGEARLHDFERLMEHPHADLMIEVCRRHLESVGARCFPLYRPVVEGYLAAAERLLTGETRGVREMLAEADQLRLRIRGIMERATDYLNYYEATQVRQRSGDFEAYRRTIDELRSARPSPRDDRISRHLDELEKEFR